jgi:hypothetical protein
VLLITKPLANQIINKSSETRAIIGLHPRARTVNVTKL